MNYYRFSDLTISMTCRYDIMKRRAEKYLIPKAKENELSETTTPEIRLNPKNELIQKYQEKYPHLTLDEAELILLSSHFSLELIKHQGFVLHASAISYNDKAVLFSIIFAGACAEHGCRCSCTCRNAFSTVDDCRLGVGGKAVYPARHLESKSTAHG